MKCSAYRSVASPTPIHLWLALFAAVALLVGGQAVGDISLPGDQHIGDQEDDELPDIFSPIDPVFFDREVNYPSHFHLTEEVTVTEISFEGLVQENDNGQPYVTIDGTDYSGTWDDTNTLTLDSPLTLAAGLHTLAVTSDCIKNQTEDIGGCNQSRTENDISFSAVNLVTQPGATTVSKHWIRRRHAGGSDDADDDYDDLGDANEKPFYYPDAAEGSPITLTFTLGSDTYFDALWMFRLREVTGDEGTLTLYRDGTEVWSDTISGNSPDMQDSPASFPIDQTLDAGSYTLEIGASEDFSWDSVILKAPGPSAGSVELGDFNVVEPDTDAVDGPLYTKVSADTFDVDVVSLGGSGNLQNFNGDVELELVEAATNTDCADLPVKALLKTVTFTGQSRLTVQGLNYDHAIGAARIRATEVAPNNPEQGCSQDVFTVRPHHLTVEARDVDWETAGTARRLDGDNSANCQSAGGSEPCHKAGRSFTLSGSPYNASDKLVSGFGGTGFVTWSLKEPPHDGDDSLGSHGPTEVSFAGDNSGFENNAASYLEVGVVELILTDQGVFTTRSGDKTEGHCVTGSSSNDPTADPAGDGRYGCQAATTAPSTAGRFVPDRFEVTHSGFAFDRACSASFTYFGQPFTWAGTPQVTITAVEQGGTTTVNYEDPFWKLVDYLDQYEDDSNADEASLDGDDRALDASGVNHSWPDTTDVDGEIVVDYAGDLVYTREDPEELISDADQLVKLRFDVIDDDGIQYEGGGNPPTYLIDPITGAGPVRWGRLNLENAHGSELEALDVPVRAEFYDDGAFGLNPDDGCSPLSMSGEADHVRMQLDDNGSWVAAEQTVDLKGGTGGTTNGTGVTGLASGVGALTLAEPGAGSTGYVSIRADLTDFPWLQEDWSDDGSYTENPTARATFGRYQGNDRILFWREVYH